MASLHVYPVKSLRGVAVEAARVHLQGLGLVDAEGGGGPLDRQFCVCDSEGFVQDLRVLPKLATIGVALQPPSHPGGTASVCRLLSTASLADLARRLPAGSAVERPVNAQRFRPNIVVEGLGAYGEDGLASFTLGPTASMSFRQLGATGRCVIPTTHPTQGHRDEEEEPRSTLMRYRPRPYGDGVHGGPVFGVWVAPDEAGGILKVGSRVSASAAVGTKLCEPAPVARHTPAVLDACQHIGLADEVRVLLMIKVRDWLLGSFWASHGTGVQGPVWCIVVYICNLVTKPPESHPSAALLPREKCVVWQIDHIGKYPADSKTGHR